MSLFITFEGPEGSGKTTQAKALAEHLSRQGHKVLVTREPGGTVLSNRIRQLLVSDADSPVEVHPLAEALLFCAARAQLVEEVLRPHLSQGYIVICDRYADSTLAYQGYGLGLDINRLRSIIEVATGGLMPDLTILLDLPVEKGLERSKRRQLDLPLDFPLEVGLGVTSAQQLNLFHASGESRIDGRELAFHRRVREGYLEMAQEGGRWVVIDGDRPVEEVEREVQQEVEARLSAAKGCGRRNR